MKSESQIENRRREKKRESKIIETKKKTRLDNE